MGGVSFISGVYLGPMFAAMYTIAPSSERATAVALVAVFTNIIGAGVGPFIVGVLSSLLTPVFDADALKLSLLASLVLFVPAVACLMLGSAHLPKDASHD
jgi:MFS family permease